MRLPVQLLQVLEDRQQPYTLELIGTTFSEAEFECFLLALLHAEAHRSISLRACPSATPGWKRREAFVLLSNHLWREGSPADFQAYVDDIGLMGMGAQPGALGFPAQSGVPEVAAAAAAKAAGGYGKGADTEPSDGARRAFAQWLLDEWMVPCQVRPCLRTLPMYKRVFALRLALRLAPHGVCMLGCTASWTLTAH